MGNDIFTLVNILNNNNLIKKVDEEFDAKFSELLEKAEIDEEVSMECSKDTFYAELDGFRNTPDLEKYLESLFLEFKRTAVDTNLVKNKLIQNEISSKIFQVREDLHKLILDTNNERFSNLESLVNIKITYCDKVLDFISNIKNEISRLSGKKSGLHTDLTQKQIVILFHHLHELGYVGKGITNDELAGLISQLTSFSADKIRQDLSLVKKESTGVDSEEFKETDYTILRRYIKRLIESIEKEQKGKFPS